MKRFAGDAPRLGVFVACVLAGCVSRHVSTSASRPALAAPSDDALDQHFKVIAAGLESDGLRRAPLLERGFLPPSGRVAYPVHIEKNECAVFVAIATTSMADLDASLYNAEGAALIEDDSTSSRPSLTFCASPSAPVDAYLTLHAYQGAGSFVAAQFTRVHRPDDDLHTAGGPGLGASALGQLAQTLHQRGFEDAAPRVSVPLGVGAVRIAVNVEAGECYTLAAEGDEGLTELSLRLVDAQGGELANGVGEPRLAALQYCASGRAELALEVVAKRGQGVAQVARFRAAQASVGGARALWLGEPSPSPAAWTRAKTAHVEPETPGPVFFTRQLALRQGEVIELVSKPAHGCEVWRAALEPGLSRASLRVESERGELLGEADSEQMVACVAVCSPAGVHRVSLLGRAGFGAVTLSGYTVATTGAAGAVGKQPDADATLVFAARACHGSSAAVESQAKVEARPRMREPSKGR